METQVRNPADEIQESHACLCFPEWALVELDRLLRARSLARTPEERFQAELQAAILQDSADRYGRHLAELAEL